MKPLATVSEICDGDDDDINEIDDDNEDSEIEVVVAKETIEVAPARARPQRVNRAQTRYVLSDSESEHATEDSEVTDESEDEQSSCSVEKVTDGILGMGT